MLGIVLTQGEDPSAAAPAFTVGFALAPVVFATVALVSAHPRAARATLKAMGLWVLITLPVSLIHPVTGLCAGFGAAGAVTLRLPEHHRRGSRALAVLLTTVYVTVLVFAVSVREAGTFAGAMLPLLGVKAADVWGAKAERSQSSGNPGNP